MKIFLKMVIMSTDRQCKRPFLFLSLLSCGLLIGRANCRSHYLLSHSSKLSLLLQSLRQYTSFNSSGAHIAIFQIYFKKETACFKILKFIERRRKRVVYSFVQITHNNGQIFEIRYNYLTTSKTIDIYIL